jgi:hypothetical protein
MGWQDRPYYRDRTPSRMGPLMWLLGGSLPLFTVFGIRVRMHASMLVTISLTLLLAQTRVGLGVQNAIVSMAILFVSVLLHEFGHCFGARWVGGEAEDILMTPIGGLAFSRPPRRPWPSFITTAAGPATTLAICLVTWGILMALGHGHTTIPWFPFGHDIIADIPSRTVAYYVWWVFLVNYGLLMFNMLLVFYPFDAGRMIQELLWVRMGYYRSMLIATPIGMFGAVGMFAFSLAVWQPLLALIGVFGFMACWRQRQLLREMGPDGFEDEGGGLYAAAYEPVTPERRRRRTSRAARRAVAQARRAAVEAKLESERLDAILAKVSSQGIGSLTWRERRALRQATEKRRKRDVELSR